MKHRIAFPAFFALAIVLAFLLPGFAPAQAARIKELVEIQGVRSNPLVGYGLVVGLAQSGDTRRSAFTAQSLSSLLKRMGLNIKPDKLDVTNTAAVMVTSELEPFQSTGDRADVLVSALGNARSLEGGTLLMTPLKGADGNVYALAQGPIIVGGFDHGNKSSGLRRNVPTVGRIPQGAMIEKTVRAEFVRDGKILLSLKESDFTTANRIAGKINEALGGERAQAVNSGTIFVEANGGEENLSPVALLAKIEALDVIPDHPARIVVNERTGTVVVGGNVTLGPAAVAHGNLDVAIQTAKEVSQPAALSYGNTEKMENETFQVEEGSNALTVVPQTTTVDDLVKALNAIGASPRDLIAILQALKATGALNGELKVL